MLARKRVTLAAAVLLIGLSGVPGAVTTEGKSSIPPGGSDSRSIVFTYQAAYTSVPKHPERFDIWLPLPAEDDNQKISDLVVYGPGASTMAEEARHKNRIYHVESGRRGGLQIQMKMTFHVTRLAIVNEDLSKLPPVPPDPPENLSVYLESNALLPIDDEIKALSARIVKEAGNDLEKARAVYEYILRSMRLDRSAPGWGQGDLKRAISVRKGNSLDLSTAFVGLARGAGVPARSVLGFLIPRGVSNGTLSGYHAWAEFYQKGRGWVPVDPALAVQDPRRAREMFGNLDAHRVAFTVGRDVMLDPPQKAGPLNFFIYPYAEMDGERMGSASYRFIFNPPE